MGVLLFAILALVVVGASVAMIGHKSPIYSALYMVVVFAATAVAFVLLEAPFVAAIQIIVYAGAIVVLFLFVIMFLSLRTEILVERRRGTFIFALVLAGLVAGQLAVVVATGSYAGDVRLPVPEGFGSVEAVSGVLFTRYLIPFEIVSILLVVGMVGAVVLARRDLAAPGTDYAPPGVAGPSGGDAAEERS